MRTSSDRNGESHEPSLATQRNWRSRKEQILQTLERVLQRPPAQKFAKKALENISQMEGLEDPLQFYRLTASGRSRLRTEADNWNRMASLIAGILTATPEDL
jgi:hypothetical protein